MWNVKYDTNELIYKTGTDSQTVNRLVGAEREGADWESGMNGCGLRYRGWENKVLLQSTQHSIQYPVRNRREKEVCVYV